jgi:branched-chain amino acid transport system ATP-binding protein
VTSTEYDIPRLGSNAVPENSVSDDRFNDMVNWSPGASSGARSSPCSAAKVSALDHDQAIMGNVRPRGSIRFRGEQIAGLKPVQTAQRGLGYVPETRDVFSALTVRPCLQLGKKRGKAAGRAAMQDMFRMFPRLEERADTRAGVLSGGEQQMPTICRTMMGDPDVVMIDEPTEGLSPMMGEHVGDLLKEIARRGVAILLIE